jgi:FkbM family methyltransferase
MTAHFHMNRGIGSLETLLQRVFRLCAKLAGSDFHLYPLAARALRWMHPSDEAVRVSTADGFQIKLKVREYPDGAMYLGIYEPGLLRLVRSLLRSGDVAIDAGANIGYITLHLSQCVGAGGRVHSFEPLPANFERLQEALHDNQCSNVSLHELAVGSSAGVVNFYSFPNEYGSTHALGSLQPLRANSVSIERKKVRLDDVVDGPVRLIKIDVEGGESDVLVGATRIIREHRPHILLENNPLAMKAFDSSLASIYRFIMSLNLGYEALDIDFYRPKLLNDEAVLNGAAPNRQCNIWLRPKIR